MTYRLKNKALKTYVKDKRRVKNINTPSPMYYRFFGLIILSVLISGILSGQVFHHNVKSMLIVFMICVILTILHCIRIARNNKKQIRYIVNEVGFSRIDTLPNELLGDRTWGYIADALVNAEMVIEEYKTESDSIRLIMTKKVEEMRTIRKQLFKKEYTWVEDYKELTLEETVENREKSLLWLLELSKTPLSERITVLGQLETDEEIEAFANRPMEYLKDFLRPIMNFLNYVEEELQRERTLKEEEIKRNKEERERRLEEEKAKIQVKADELFKLGYVDFYKLHKVEIPKGYEIEKKGTVKRTVKG